MKQTVIVVFTAVIFLLIGGSIIAWSVLQGGGIGDEFDIIPHFTDTTFEKDVVEPSKKRPVLVDFYAPWCFPCKFYEPMLREMVEELGDSVVIGKVNIDQNLIGRRLGVKRVPTVLIIRDGEIKNAFLGVQPKEILVKALVEHGATEKVKALVKHGSTDK